MFIDSAMTVDASLSLLSFVVAAQFFQPRNREWPDELRRAIGSTKREIPNASW